MSMLFKRIKDWATSITAFRTGDVMPVDGPSGTAKMPKDDLLRETAQNALAGNVAIAFVPNETNAVAGFLYAYGGKVYVAKENYNGAWDATKFTQVPISSILSSIDNDLGNAISFLNEKGKSEISTIYQYVDPDDLNEGYFWLDGVMTANATFNAYDPFVLGAGEYTLIGTLYTYSYVEVGGTLTKWADYFGNASYLTDSDFTLTTPVKVYLCVNKNTNPQIRIVDKNSTISSQNVPYEKGLLLGVLNKLIKVPLLDNFLLQYPIESSVVEDAIYQYVDPDELNEGYFWLDGVMTANATFNAYDAFTLGAGEYTLIGTLYSYSYVEVNGVLTKWADYFGSSSYLTDSDFTLTTPVNVYLCVNKNTNPQIRIIKKTSVPYSAETLSYDKGIVKAKLNRNIEIELPPVSADTSYYDQAFIKDGVLTCNNDHLNANTSVAKYTCVDMGSDVTEIKCRGKFKAITPGVSITLISTNLETYNNVQNITRGSLHIGFGSENAGIDLYINNSLVSLGTKSYTIDADTEYEFGWSVAGNTLTVNFPDGTSQTYTDERISGLNGRYMIFEHFKYLNTATDVPTDDFGQPVITGIYCSCASGHPLRDNFQRQDGCPNVAPSGHAYKQFRNAAVSGDTDYDMTGASTN